ncbi:DNA-directed RNA polymerase II subunit N/Rpb10 [Pandoravirus inopinatum]|uniref:DNA-directed RNA polymerase RPB10 homolog n=1 Tax=Pandoravirus inopinatum TaxID=1605721 RepID=A0A0B5J2P6_9VIRU|nr:DNA-directed RNA polymerase II subunit N/Rpb10 [Pandoravirus inopinatum]AJF97839.1 DNA-directed RNA polymerase II subunit N/Rpb10 [Pandoravirus inopinatum]
MIPVRCFTCGFVLGNLERPYQRLLRDMPAGAALDALGLTSDKRDCCRWVMLTYVDVTEAVLDFEHANALKAPDDTSDEYVTVHGPGPMRRPTGVAQTGGGLVGDDDDQDEADRDDDDAVGYGGLRRVPNPRDRAVVATAFAVRASTPPRPANSDADGASSSPDKLFFLSFPSSFFCAKLFFCAPPLPAGLAWPKTGHKKRRLLAPLHKKTKTKNRIHLSLAHFLFGSPCSFFFLKRHRKKAVVLFFSV